MKVPRRAMADAAMAGRAARAEEVGYMKTYLNLHMFRYQNEGVAVTTGEAPRRDLRAGPGPEVCAIGGHRLVRDRLSLRKWTPLQ